MSPTSRERLIEELGKRDAAVLDGLRVLGVAPLLVAFFGALEWAGGRGSPLLFVHLFGSALTAGVVWWRNGPIAARRALLCAGITVSAGIGLLHWGPLLGTGAYLVVAVMAAGFFLGNRGLAAVVSTLAACMVLLVAGVRFGWLTPVYAVSTAAAWARLSLAAAFLLGTAAYLFRNIGRNAREAIRAQVEAREQREEMEQERERLREQALLAQRLEGIGRLAGGVAHDFNNALMVVLPNVELLRHSPALRPEDRELLAEVATAARRAESTSKALLAFARWRPEDAGACSPDRVLQRFAGSFGRLLTEHTRLSVEAPEVPRVPLAESALEQVLMNLSLNARDAMPAGGALRMSCQHEPGTGRVVIEVADSGAGMTEEVRARVFEPFYTTKSTGTGLGLPMVWGVVTRAGGTVAVESKVGDGTRVRLTFPPAPAALAPIQTRVAPADAAPALPSEHRVLLLEDDDLVRRAFTRILERGGWQVTAFERAAPAIEAARQGGFHALVTDASVPDGGVPTLMSEFRRAHPHALILLCSGHLEEDLVSVGIQQGDFRFLRKPVQIDQLLGALAGAGSPLRHAG